MSGLQGKRHAGLAGASSPDSVRFLLQDPPVTSLSPPYSHATPARFCSFIYGCRRSVSLCFPLHSGETIPCHGRDGVDGLHRSSQLVRGADPGEHLDRGLGRAVRGFGVGSRTFSAKRCLGPLVVMFRPALASARSNLR